MARMLDVDTTAMAAVLDDLPARIGGVVTVGGTASTGLCGIVLAEAAIALAQIHAEVEPTVLIFDEILNGFHPAPQAALTRLLLSKTEGFQSVIITHSPAVLMTCDADWLLARFSSNRHGPGITQDRTVGHAVNAETGAVRVIPWLARLFPGLPVGLDHPVVARPQQPFQGRDCHAPPFVCQQGDCEQQWPHHGCRNR